MVGPDQSQPIGDHAGERQPDNSPQAECRPANIPAAPPMRKPRIAATIDPRVLVLARIA